MIYFNKILFETLKIISKSLFSHSFIIILLFCNYKQTTLRDGRIFISIFTSTSICVKKKIFLRVFLRNNNINIRNYQINTKILGKSFNIHLKKQVFLKLLFLLTWANKPHQNKIFYKNCCNSFIKSFWTLEYVFMWILINILLIIVLQYFECRRRKNMYLGNYSKIWIFIVIIRKKHTKIRHFILEKLKHLYLNVTYLI